MSRFEAANLIRVFDFYLAAMFLMSLVRRYPVYWDAVRLAAGFGGRWRQLGGRLRLHSGAALTVEVIRPVAVALGLMAVQYVLSWLVFPHAEVTVGEVAGSWWRLALLTVVAAPMLAVDAYFLIQIGRFDRGETEKYLDQAEHWLGTWKAPAVRAVTLGYVDPRRMVDAEVRKGLVEVGRTLGWAARWAAVQTGCRVAVGLAIWLLWAFAGERGASAP